MLYGREIGGRKLQLQLSPLKLMKFHLVGSWKLV